MTDQHVTCRHCGIGINYQCDCDDDAAEERGREEVWGKVLDTLRTVYGRDMPYNESPCELIADLVPPGDVAAVREAAARVAALAEHQTDQHGTPFVTLWGQEGVDAMAALRRSLAARDGGAR